MSSNVEKQHVLMKFWLISLIVWGITAHSVAFGDELPLRSGAASAELLVLIDGQVVTGRLTPRTGGYDVAFPNGRLFVSSDRVRFRASGMEDAYLKMRASVQNLTPTTHLEIAKWCVVNKLPGQARRELLDALHLDPDLDAAKHMLEGLLREQQRSLEVERMQNAERTRQMVNDATRGIPLPERRSLGGLPKDMALVFTRNVQPLLSNKCGNARCHGAREEGFHLSLVRGNSSAIVAEQNLAAVLNQLDLQHPDRSPLLLASQGLHGGNRRLLFSGQTGGRQLELLRDWVTRVSQDLGGAEAMVNSTIQTVGQTTNSGDPNSGGGELRAAGFESGDATNSSTDSVNFPTAHHSQQNGSQNLTAVIANPHSTMRSTEDTDQKFLQEAAAAARRDKFDPDVFNRKFHPSAKAP